MTRIFVVSSNGSLADVFVFIKTGTTAPPPPIGPVILNQAGCEFQPYVFGLQTGQPVMISNSDPVLHNIHIVPKAPGNIESNQAQMASGPAVTKTFATPELFVTFKCDVHPWMFAYACVVEHPWFAVTDEDGAFQIPNLPPGTYTLAAVHRKAGELTREIVVGEGASEPINFTFELSPVGKQLADSKPIRPDAL